MANVAIFDPNATPQKVLSYLTSVSSPDFDKRTDVLINPDVSQVKDLPLKYWKVVTGNLAPMDPAEQATVDASIKTAEVSANRGSAKAFFFAQSPEGVIWRATLTWLIGDPKPTDLADAVSQIQQIIDSGTVDS